MSDNDFCDMVGRKFSRLLPEITVEKLNPVIKNILAQRHFQGCWNILLENRTPIPQGKLEKGTHIKIADGEMSLIHVDKLGRVEEVVGAITLSYIPKSFTDTVLHISDD